MLVYTNVYQQAVTLPATVLGASGATGTTEWILTGDPAATAATSYTAVRCSSVCWPAYFCLAQVFNQTYPRRGVRDAQAPGFLKVDEVYLDGALMTADSTGRIAM
jgi:hypothetical protein